jgi:hypothetical protein
VTAPGVPPAREAGDTAMTRTYVAVIVLEVVVLAALWLFQSAFSS